MEAARGNKAWFAAQLLFESVDCESNLPTAREHQIVLVRASSTEQAQQKAAALGRSSETEYEAAAGNRVRWRLVEVADVQSVLEDEIRDGAEVYFWHEDLATVGPATG